MHSSSSRFSLTSLSFLLVSVLLSFSLFVTPVLSAPLNLNVDPSFFCYSNAVIVWNLLIFYASNFLAHAASVPLSAETGRFTQRVTVERPIPWASIISLFLPFGGLGRAILLIAQQLKWKDDDIRASLAHGALHVVARTEDWEPQKGVRELVFVKLPPEYAGITKEEATNTFAAFKLEEEGESHWTINCRERKLYGEIVIPTGYSLAAPADKSITEHIIASNLEDTCNIKFHRSQSLLKVGMSIVQIISAFVALRTSLGDQIDHFGYAAYGLSVVPYALMSFVNMICAGVVGDFSCGHVLRTPILQEAEKRSGALFHGSVGRLKDINVPLGTTTQSGFTAVWLSVKAPDPHRPSDSLITLVIEGVDGRKEFIFSPGAIESAKQKVYLGISPVTHDGPVPQTALDPLRRVSPWEIISITVCFLIAMIVPYVVMYLLTGFQEGHSTVAQRVWMLVWLFADQISALGTLVFWVIWKYRGSCIPIAVHYLGVSALLVPAAGGLVMVGIMFMEDNRFGSCASC